MKWVTQISFMVSGESISFRGEI